MIDITKYQDESYEAKTRLERAREVEGMQIFLALKDPGYSSLFFYDEDGKDVIYIDPTAEEQKHIVDYLIKNRMKELEA